MYVHFNASKLYRKWRLFFVLGGWGKGDNDNIIWNERNHKPNYINGKLHIIG
jgi:hypothetical protein